MKILFKILCMLLISSTVFAGTYYIDYNASDDSGAATQGDPWKRCPGMVGFSGSYSPVTGDVFIFKRGVTWPAAALPLAVPYSGSSGTEYQYKSIEGWGTGNYAIFDAQSTDSYVVTAVYGRKYFILNGIELANATVNSISGNGDHVGVQILNCYFNNTNLRPDFQGGTNLRIENNIFEGTGGTTVEIMYSPNVIIRNNDITGSTGSNSYYALKIGDGCTDAIIEFNFIHDYAGGIGIVYRDDSCNSTIRYNIVDHTDSAAGEAFSSWDIHIGSCDGGYKVYNNTVIIKSGRTAFDQQNTTGNYYYNNIVYSIDGGGTAFQGRWGGCMTSDYNDAYNVSTLYSEQDGCTISGKTHNITSNPGLVNVNDLPDGAQLSASDSLAVNAGLPYDDYSGTDYWGNDIVGNPDIGAHEYTAGETPASPSMTGITSNGVTSN